MKEMTELKPCPFCGSKNTACSFYTTHTEGMEDHYYIGCKNCGANGSRGKSEEEAIEAWNRRVNDNDV